MSNETEYKQNIIYRATTKASSFFGAFLTTIVGIMAIVVVFLISCVRPNGEMAFLETLKDPVYWTLTGITIVVAITVAVMNYKSTKAKEKQKDYFLGALLELKKQKTEASFFYDELWDWCVGKTEQMKMERIYELIDLAGFKFTEFVDIYKSNVSLLLKKEGLEPWQKRHLKRALKVKPKPLTVRLLLQETEKLATSITLLPAGESELENKFLMRTTATKIATFIISSLAITLTFAFGNWLVGITNALGVLITLATAIVSATQDVNVGIRSRIIARSDLLTEFNLSMRKKHNAKEPNLKLKTLYNEKTNEPIYRYELNETESIAYAKEDINRNS